MLFSLSAFFPRVGSSDKPTIKSIDALKKIAMADKVLMFGSNRPVSYRPPNIVVALMADAYNQPELRQWYCANECPLGKDRISESDTMPPERALIRLKKGMKEIDKAMQELANIMDDGVISEEEMELLPNIMEQFMEARKRIDENIMAIERSIKHKSFNKY